MARYRADSALTSETNTHDLDLIDLHALLSEGPLRMAVQPPRPREYRDETPIYGKGGVSRWLALYDRAHTLHAALCPGDGVGARQVQRAIRSLFLYEHQLTPPTRRQARTALWRRDRAEPLPTFAERARWARCRCTTCQPAQQAEECSTLVLRIA